MMAKNKMKSKQKTLLIKNPEYLVTLNPNLGILRRASVFIRGKRVIEINTQRKRADRIIDATGMIVFPGFVNTHLHTPQVFHRHCPAQQNKPIAQWIRVTTSINREIDSEAMYFGALVCFAELMLSGVTTTLDYFYPFVRKKKGTMEATIKAAKDIGIRLTSVRGSMSQSKKNGTLYEEEVVEDQDQILTHSREVIEKYHDKRKYSVVRIGLGPCLPFSSVEKDFRAAADLARKYNGVILQTHAAESKWEVDYCQEKFGISPIGLMQKTGFLGKDVSLVHCNVISDGEIELLGKTETNIVVTPICNTRDAADGNGIAPMTRLQRVGANLSIGVDGPASNDSMNFQDEMRYLRTVSKAKEGLYWYANQDQSQFSYLNPEAVLSIANLGGARTLNRTDIGQIDKNKAADIAIFNPDESLFHAGALNKWGAIMSCQSLRPEYLIVNGRIVVENKQLKQLEEVEINRSFRRLLSRVIQAAKKRSRVNLLDY